MGEGLLQGPEMGLRPEAFPGLSSKAASLHASVLFVCEGSGTQGKENFWRAAGKRGREAALRAIPIPSGAAISALPSASLKQRVPQGVNKRGFFWGRPHRGGHL